MSAFFAGLLNMESSVTLLYFAGPVGSGQINKG